MMRCLGTTPRVSRLLILSITPLLPPTENKPQAKVRCVLETA
jgi:hypothetical protein